ncbi:MAG: amidase [Alphaproteobacteria bacterium]
MKTLGTVAALQADLARGATTSVALTERALAAAADPQGEGPRAFTKLYRDAALAQARASDALRKAGIVASPVAGLPISIKDLFDVAGETTLAGSVVRKGAPAAGQDAAAIARLRQAGAVIVGRTNMTEFAYSGLGINPHYGTPANLYDRAARRIPGGSSSGAAVSVTDGMAVAGIGTDTGGSVRIPSALNGITGFKPTARRVPTSGCFPLSSTLDSVGPLAASVACCAVFDAIMAGAEPVVPPALPIAGLRLGAVQKFVLDGVDRTVAAAYQAALRKLAAAGARIVDVAFDELLEIPKINAAGGFSPPEAFALHRAMLASDEAKYDPRIAARIKKGAAMTASEYVDLISARADLISRANKVTAPFDAMMMPSVAVAAPPIAPLEADDELYMKTNMLILRNTALGNLLDRCAISLPCHVPGEAPVGLMLMGETMGDAKLLSVALAVETALHK